METKCETKKEGAVARHCAYCLQLCGTTKLCGGCKKRAYCSKECQRADWSIQGNGQRHVNWCRRHECGEEDVDWEVVPIPNKGLGIRAKKLIPVGLKIIVEPVFSSPNDHSEIMDLKGATLEEKFSNNSFRGVNVDHFIHIGVALRNYRVNHACQPNASAIYDEAARVAILFAQKNIHPGEEITICYYTPFFGLTPYVPSLRLMIPEFNSIEEELNFFHDLMALEHGITCPTDCFCNDPAILALVSEGRQIQSTIIELTNKNLIEEALDNGDKLLDIHRRLNVSWPALGSTYYNLFRMGICSSRTFPRAKEYLRLAAGLYRKMCPYSEKLTKKYEKLLERPDLHRHFKMMD